MRSLFLIEQGVQLGQKSYRGCLRQSLHQGLLQNTPRCRVDVRCWASAAQEELVKASIPRQPGVTEGVWDRADRVAVQEALVDSQQASTSGRSAEAGEHTKRWLSMPCKIL